MTWKKYFRTPSNSTGSLSPISGGGANPSWKNYQSTLPEVYVGHPNRIERYNQYEQMDMDVEVNAALDVLSEFSTQPNVENGTIFDISFIKEPTENEVTIIKDQLTNWVKLNEFKQRAFRIFRNTLKYGDQVFIRDPETFKLYWVNMAEVVKVIVNESEGKEPEQYVVKNLAPNLENLSATQKPVSDIYIDSNQAGYNTPGYQQPTASGMSGGRFSMQQNEATIDAEHILHLSLTEGLDVTWPFGTSVLEQVFKVYKQKELLEDAILIYRIQRAPERRIFKIDVGNMPSHMAMQFVERVKNEIHQRRIPSQTGDGATMMDGTYNPLCLDLSTKIPLLDGRILDLNELIAEFNSGKENWAYSCDPNTGKVVPGLIDWAGVTRTDAETIKLTFDNNETLVCTPDHKIPVFGKGFVKAKDITENDSLISFNTRDKSIAGGKTNEYQQVWDHESKTWKFTHRVVGEFFKDKGQHQEFTFLQEHATSETHYTDEKEIDNFNHTVVKIEKVANRDVGTITIDGTEKWHNYHTFAIESGIFVKNSINEDYFFPVTADGRGSDVDTLPGGDNLGEINDLQYFNNKLVRGLRIPSSYLPTGPDESERTYNDGKVGTALIQEWRFNQYCIRLQGLMSQKLDKEFKMFLNWRGINIDNSIFELHLNEPQNFAAYSQADVDSVRIQTFSSVADLPYISKRFALKRYMGMTEEEMTENNKLWAEEQGDVDGTEGDDSESDLRAAGVSPGGIEGDIDTFDELEDVMGDEEGMDLEGGADAGAEGGADASAETPLDI